MGADGPGQRYLQIRQSLPDRVRILVAAKGRSARGVGQVLEAGARIVGHNYVQEAERMWRALGEVASQAELHMIGHLQRNKVNRALGLFDSLQSLDSLRLARALDKRAERTLPVLVQVNVAGEESKFGIPPREAPSFIREVAGFERLRIDGLMTMEPYCEDPEDARPYLRRMRGLFEELRAAELPGVRMEVLSMGMSGSYRVAVQEGATMVRLGTAIFGPRR